MPEIDVWSKIREADDLPVLSETATKVIHAATDKKTSLKAIAEIIAQNPTLSQKVLAAVNYANQDRSRPVESIQQAVVILGIEVIASFLVLDLFPKEATDKFDYTIFWERAICAGTAAKAIAARAKLSLVEEAFIAGFLEDVGILLLAHYAADAYSQVCHEAEERGVGLTVVEEETLGVTHLEVGQFLAEQWGLPECLSTPIACHHQIQNVEGDPVAIKLTELAHLGNLVSDIWYGWDKTLKLSVFKAELAELMRFDETVADDLLRNLSSGITEVSLRLQVPVAANRTYDDILQEATAEARGLRRTYDRLYRDSKRTRGELEKKLEEIARLAAKMEEREREVVTLIDHDPLTGFLTNRFIGEVMIKEVSRARRYNRPLSAILVDIDRFAAFNEAHGVRAGNFVIRGIAQIVTKCVRESDLVARYGGEEFLVLLVETELSGATIAAEKIRRVVERWQIIEGGVPLSVTVSIGVAKLTPVEMSADEFLEKIQSALDKAKDAGGNATIAEGEGES